MAASLSFASSIKEVAEFKVDLDASVGVEAGKLSVTFDPERFGRSAVDDATEATIDDSWKSMKRANPRLYNASKFRFAGGSCSKEGSATIELGLTDMKGFRNTNMGANHDMFLSKGKESGAARRYMADPLETTVIVETVDGFVPLLARHAHSAHAPGAVDAPCGTPEPSAVGIPLSSVVVIGGPSKPRRPGKGATADPATMGAEIAQSLFDISLAELTDELNLATDKLSGQKFLGIARRTQGESMLTAVFCVKYAGTLEDVRERYEMGSKDNQSKALIMVPVTQLLALNTTEPGITVSGCRQVLRAADGTPVAAEDDAADVQSDDISASAKAAMELWRMHKQKLAARRRSLVGL